MNQVDYLPIANNPGANVESQAQYVLDLADPGQLLNGYKLGTAHSLQVNKTLRQSSMIAACIGNFISQELAIDVIDDGNVPALIVNFIAAVKAAAGNPFSTGDLKTTLKTVADAGWVLCNDGTIGNAASGASYANVAASALFALLWTNFSDALCPVLPAGRGANAAADFAANKTIGLTKMLGRALAVAGAGAGLTNRVLGSTVGEETHALTANEGPNHTHAINDPGHAHSVPDSGPQGAGIVALVDSGTVTPLSNLSTAAAQTNITVLASGAGAGHNTMQPTAFVNVMIKL